MTATSSHHGPKNPVITVPKIAAMHACALALSLKLITAIAATAASIIPIRALTAAASEPISRMTAPMAMLATDTP